MPALLIQSLACHLGDGPLKDTLQYNLCLYDEYAHSLHRVARCLSWALCTGFRTNRYPPYGLEDGYIANWVYCVYVLGIRTKGKI